MRLSALAIFFAVLSSAALGDAPAATGWYLTQNGARSPFHIGTGTPNGMAGTKAIYVMGKVTGRMITTPNSAQTHGAMERIISLAPWRGKRLSLTLRMKNEGRLTAFASFFVFQSDGNGIRSFPQTTDFGSDEWKTEQFVVDVPQNATNLIVDVGLTGEGKVWVDGTALDEVSANTPVSDTRRVIASAPVGCGVRSLGTSPESYSNCSDIWGGNVAPPERDDQGNLRR